jgi:hypothetical protein
MKKTLLYGLACAVGLTGIAETSLAWAKQSAPAQGVRADVRASALESLERGNVQEVANRKATNRKVTNRKVKRKRYRARGPAATLRSVHSRGRWCGEGRWYGKRCYYTPSGLRPFRQR